MRVIATISRILVGLLFIFSGFVKANDPLGFSYKLEEYYHVFGLDFLVSSALFQAMFICVLEIILGFAVLIGTRMKVTSSLIMAMIIFFSLLTGYTAISNWFFENPEAGTTQWFANLFSFNPKNIYYMTDCGCFGEFIKLTPWQSFTKDLILLVFIIIIFIRRSHTRSLFSRNMQTNIIVSLSVLFTMFTVYCYMYLPMINFLYWDDGNNVAELMVCPPDAPKDSVVMTFVYKVGEQETTFSYDDVMAMKVPEGAEFVKQDRKIIREGCKPKIMGFTMYNPDNVDYKDSMLQNNDFQLLVVAYDLEHSRKRGMKAVSELAKEFIEKDGKKVWGLTGTTLEDAEKYRHEYGLIFDFYSVDPKMGKSMIRSNAGLILMKGSVVIKTWPARSIPSAEKVRKIMAKN